MSALKYAKLMYLVTPEKLMQFQQSTPEKNITERRVDDLQHKMQTVLTQPNQLNASSAIKNFNQNLLKRLQLSKHGAIEEQQQPQQIKFEDTPPISTSTDLSVKDIVDLLPNSYQNAGKRLLTTIQAQSSIVWDRDGNVFINGSQIPGANIVALTQDAMRARKTVGRPPGYVAFYEALKHTDANKHITRQRRSSTGGQHGKGTKIKKIKFFE